MTGLGVTAYIGPGYVFHWSTEDGFQRERAPHRTWRFGLVIALRTDSSRRAANARRAWDWLDGEPSCPVCMREGRLEAGRYDYKPDGGTVVWTCGHAVGK